jgi:hypothetical protein
MSSKKKSHTGYRDSKSGEFVKPDYAKRHPATTQKESIPNPGRADTGRARSRKDGTGSTGPRKK